MAELKRFTMSYKAGFVEKQLSIRTWAVERAEVLGRGWCDERAGHRYLRVEEFQEIVDTEKVPESPIRNPISAEAKVDHPLARTRQG